MNISGQSGRFPDSLEDFLTVWKIFWTVWEISGESRRYIQTSLKIFQQSGRFPKRVEDFWTVCRISRFTSNWNSSRQYGRYQTGKKISGNFERLPDSLGFMLLKQSEMHKDNFFYTRKIWAKIILPKKVHILRRI